MKQIITIAFIIISIQISNAQVWVEIGAKGSYGMSLLMNSNIFDDNTYNHQFTGASGFGGRLGINFGPSHGISMDVMSHRMSQKFEYKLLIDNSFHDNTVNWKNLDLYLLYKYSNSRVFLELGPMLSLVRSVEHEDQNLAVLVSTSGANIEDFYRDKYYSAVFGFGGYLVGTETFSLNFGARIHYAMQDFITAEGQRPSLPLAQSFPAPVRQEIYADYSQTRPLFVELSLELTFGLGEFARSSCSDRMHWFWSGNR